MKLKKINENLQENLVENGLTEANEMQKETFSTLKSGTDCIIIAPHSIHSFPFFVDLVPSKSH